LCLPRKEIILLHEKHAYHGFNTSTFPQSPSDLWQTLVTHVEHSKRWQSAVLDAIRDSQEREPDRNKVHACSSFIQNYIVHDLELFGRDLLSALCFRELDSRRDGVVTAYDKTFNWIFDPHPLERQKWDSFVEWLQGDQSLYWITGKPGSGKSTLMKFICDDLRTKFLLERWACRQDGFEQGIEMSDAHNLLISSFYFWNSGTEIQMSQEGLVRSLLHDILQRLPHLISIAFPNILKKYTISGSVEILKEPWRWDELRQAFLRVLSAIESLQKVVFFIDGLDEYHGSHADMIEFIQDLTGPNIKLCISSRPWNIFEDAFKQRPSLRLEDLTFSDIRYYVDSKLSSNPGFTELQVINSPRAKQLVENVTIKASGVFLWVCLVTKSLLEGLSDGERLSDLQRRLDSLPADLEKLFWKMLGSLDAFHLERASQFFQILRSSQQTLTVLQLSYADEETKDFALNLPIAPLSKEISASRAEIMRRRVNACCKGLLDVCKHGDKRALGDSEVGYLHRTVKDFLELPVVWDKIRILTTDDFRPNVRLFWSYLSYLKTMDAAKPSEIALREAILYGMGYLIRASSDSHRFLISDFELIDQAATQCWERRSASPWASIVVPSSRRCSTFQHLAALCKIVPYVKHNVAQCSLADRPRVASDFLEMATMEYFSESDALNFAKLHNEPDQELILFLLDSGADPNMILPPGGTIWETVIRWHASSRQNLFKAFLKHGANPCIEPPSSYRLDEETTKLFAVKKKEAEIGSMTKRPAPWWEDKTSAAYIEFGQMGIT
jgi:hypothetical protein